MACIDSKTRLPLHMWKAAAFGLSLGHLGKPKLHPTLFGYVFLSVLRFFPRETNLLVCGAVNEKWNDPQERSSIFYGFLEGIPKPVPLNPKPGLVVISYYLPHQAKSARCKPRHFCSKRAEELQVDSPVLSRESP